MSIKAETKQTIRNYMLEHIDADDKEFLSKSIANFGISRTTAYSYLKQLLEEEIVVKADDAKCKYRLKEDCYEFCYSTDRHLEEDQLFANDVHPLISSLPENVYVIWRHIFTEMMNNAIEHAGAESIQFLLSQNRLYTDLLIMDDGIGIFRKIQLFFEAKGEQISLDEAVDILFPGKFTTAEKNHSGEGIFFSSRAADRFCIYSDRKFFAHRVFSEYKFNSDKDIIDKGTCVIVRLANNSSKQLKDVFDMFTDPDRGFFKTQIPVAHMFTNGYPVSRSEARRLGAYIKDFEEVNLDFKNVSDIGQAFVHELFVVFQNNHPHIQMHCVNANDSVDRMIRRVKNS